LALDQTADRFGVGRTLASFTSATNVRCSRIPPRTTSSLRVLLHRALGDPADRAIGTIVAACAALHDGAGDRVGTAVCKNRCSRET